MVRIVLRLLEVRLVKRCILELIELIKNFSFLSSSPRGATGWTTITNSIAERFLLTREKGASATINNSRVSVLEGDDE